MLSEGRQAIRAARLCWSIRVILSIAIRWPTGAGQCAARRPTVQSFGTNHWKMKLALPPTIRTTENIRSVQRYSNVREYLNNSFRPYSRMPAFASSEKVSARRPRKGTTSWERWTRSAATAVVASAERRTPGHKRRFSPGPKPRTGNTTTSVAAAEGDQGTDPTLRRRRPRKTGRRNDRTNHHAERWRSHQTQFYNRK